MNWRWRQSTGELFRVGSPVITPFAVGYAGVGPGKNDPEMQCTGDIGPIPRGWYTLGQAVNHPAPVSIPLAPDASNEMCGRTNFLIHADSIRFPGFGSEGCIVISDPQKRAAIRDSGINRLEVVQ